MNTQEDSTLALRLKFIDNSVDNYAYIPRNPLTLLFLKILGKQTNKDKMKLEMMREEINKTLRATKW